MPLWAPRARCWAAVGRQWPGYEGREGRGVSHTRMPPHQLQCLPSCVHSPNPIALCGHRHALPPRKCPVAKGMPDSMWLIIESTWVRLPWELGGESPGPVPPGELVGAPGSWPGCRGCSSQTRPSSPRDGPHATLNHAITPLPPPRFCLPNTSAPAPQPAARGASRRAVPPGSCPRGPARQLALPAPTCPQPSRSVHPLLSKLTIHFMYFNLGRTFIWLKFPFQGLECALHTQAGVICLNFVRRSWVYKDSN